MLPVDGLIKFPVTPILIDILVQGEGLITTGQSGGARGGWIRFNHAHASETLYYYHNDHLGTPQTLTNEAQAVVWKAEYSPFGKADVSNDVDGDGKTVTQPLRFPGQYEDEETGLYYNYYRTYDPGVGRYVTSDPIGLGGGENTYSYVRGNPLYWSDSLGLVNVVSKPDGNFERITGDPIYEYKFTFSNYWAEKGEDTAANFLKPVFGFIRDLATEFGQKPAGDVDLPSSLFFNNTRRRCLEYESRLKNAFEKYCEIGISSTDFMTRDQAEGAIAAINNALNDRNDEISMACRELYLFDDNEILDLADQR